MNTQCGKDSFTLFIYTLVTAWRQTDWFLMCVNCVIHCINLNDEEDINKSWIIYATTRWVTQTIRSVHTSSCMCVCVVVCLKHTLRINDLILTCIVNMNRVPHLHLNLLAIDDWLKTTQWSTLHFTTSQAVDALRTENQKK